MQNNLQKGKTMPVEVERLKRKIRNGNLVQLFSYSEKDGFEIKFGFIVSQYRKPGHLSAVILQTNASRKMTPNAQSLYESCFKGW